MRLLPLCLFPASLSALTIEIDYRYDTNGFFDAPGSRDAMEAAAARWSAIIDQELLPATFEDNNQDIRISFTHPGTGSSYQISAAASAASDRLASNREADEYRGPWSIPADTLVIYAGGRNITSAGLGGTGTGLNYTSVFDDPSGPHNRGFNVGFGTLPVWGGVVTFDTDRNWHFDLESAAANGDLDFYSIALHEIGHVLGLSTNWDDWEDLESSTAFNGAAAAAAYNEANGTQVTSLSMVSTSDSHWKDAEYQAPIFPAGDPVYVGTVGEGEPQDLLMEPIANFTNGKRRFEVTTVEVAALEDIGWSVIAGETEDPLDAWRLANFGSTANEGVAADAFDFDQDGLANLIEYAAGTNPTVAERGLLGSEILGDRLAVRLPFEGGADGVRLVVEGSPTLENGSWVELLEVVGSSDPVVLVEGVQVSYSIVNEVTLMSVTTSEDIASDESQFLRVVAYPN
ncbi:MAG: matrixin family metalloprotease [Verrucomicrobiota bacterium JB023]|nr:matrixin family metalloprotease [Verrucomicrobiota bacterium JB023]